MNKLLCIVLALVMCLSLCACGGESTTEPNESNDAIIGVPEETSPETVTPSTSPTETPTKPTETETPTETPTAPPATEEPKPTETQKPTTPPATEEPKPTETQKPATHTHSYGGWKTVTAATCTTSGVKQRSCSCGDIQKETIPATGHKEVVDKAVAATCTKTGLTEGKHCSTCNAVLVKQETVAALDHVYDNGFCTRCGARKASEGLKYAKNNEGGCYSVAGIGSCTDTDVVIPDTYLGWPVTEINGQAFSNCTGLTSITIPNSVTGINYRAFSDCTNLTSITIPNSVTSIASSAFKGCTGLTSITIPNGVTIIYDSVFEGCTGLTSITIPNGVTSIGSFAFNGCTGLTSITIPDSVTSIGLSAFQGTAYYKDPANWKDDVLYIGKHLIRAQKTLSGAYAVKDGTKCIADRAFQYCTGLASITIPDSVTKISKLAFWNCTGLTSITIPDSVTSIYYGAFENCTALVSIDIPDSVTYIGEYAFQSCTGLASITIGNGVEYVGLCSFEYCASLTDIYYGGTYEQWKAIGISRSRIHNYASYVQCSDGYYKILN